MKEIAEGADSALSTRLARSQLQNTAEGVDSSGRDRVRNYVGDRAEGRPNVGRESRSAADGQQKPARGQRGSGRESASSGEQRGWSRVSWSRPCYNCGKLGHTASHCPSPVKSGETDGSKRTPQTGSNTRKQADRSSSVSRRPRRSKVEDDEDIPEDERDKLFEAGIDEQAPSLNRGHLEDKRGLLRVLGPQNTFHMPGSTTPVPTMAAPMIHNRADPVHVARFNLSKNKQVHAKQMDKALGLVERMVGSRPADTHLQ